MNLAEAILSILHVFFFLLLLLKAQGLSMLQKVYARSTRMRMHMCAFVSPKYTRFAVADKSLSAKARSLA